MIKNFILHNNFIRYFNYYLSYFGIKTKTFNGRIENRIQKNYPDIKLKLGDIKILLNISKLSIDLETDYPTILSENDKIKFKSVSTTYDLKSFFKREFAIKNLAIESEKNQIKKIIKFINHIKIALNY